MKTRRAGVVGGRFAAPHPPEGLAGAAGEVLWLGLPLRERQERACLGAGVELHERPEQGQAHLLLREDAAVTAEALAAFLDLAAARGQDAAFRASGRAGALASELAFGDPGPLVVWLAPGGEASPERIAAAAPLEVEAKERLFPVPVARGGASPDLVEIPLTDRIVLPAAHWLQCLWANLLGLAPFLWRELAGRNVAVVVWRALGAALRAGSVDPRRVGASLGRRGRDCRIHPSAVVEGCWLGDGVEIGANAVVRASVLADGAGVEDLAVVDACVLGRGARVQRQGMVKYSVLMDRAMAAGAMQLGVLDQDASLKWGAALMDQAFDQGVRVRVHGQVLDAPVGLAGCCLGRGSTVGVGVLVAPGRAIPAGLELVPPPEVVVRSIPAGLSGMVTVRGGRLEPL